MVFSPRQRLALLLGFALLVIFRLPQAWIHGRFLDEEGSIFFAFAWHRPALAALFQSFGGYLNLAANAVTLADARLVRAGAVPLEWAPYLTMAAATLVQLLPAMLILTARGRWLTSRWAVIAALLTLAVSASTEEVFSNVLHIQFHLALCTALILALELPATLRARIGSWAILFFAPLCGPGAIVLMPFFLLRSLVERSRARLAQSIALGSGIAIQLLIFFTPSPVRGQFLDPATLAAILFVRLIALPFRGFNRANRAGLLIYESHQAGGHGWWWAVAGAVAFLGLLVVLALRDRRDPAIWLIVPALAIAIVSFGGGMIVSDPRDWFSVGAGERYNFLPLVLMTLALVVLARRTIGVYRPACFALCLLTLYLGVKRYPKPLEELSTGPVWSREVAAWRRDHDYPLKVWPRTWSMDLSDRDLPCTPPGRGAAASHDPGYCESVWLARVAKPIVARPAAILPRPRSMASPVP